MKALKALNPYLWRYKWHLLGGVLFTFISNYFLIQPAPIVRNAFNSIEQYIAAYQAGVLDSSTFERQIITYGVLLLLMAAGRGVFLFFMRQTIIVMSRLIEYDLKNDIFWHYQTLPLAFYRQNNTGDLMARISEDVSNVRMYLGPGIMYGLNLVSLFLMLIPYMLSVDVKLTLYTLLPLPVLSTIIYFVNNIINKRSTEIQRKLSDLSTYVQEAFSGIRVLKAFAREQDSGARFAQESEAYRQQALRLARVEALFYPAILALIGLSNIIVVYVGGIEVAAGNITKGNIAEFILYLNMLIWPVTSLGWITSIIQQAAASQERINEFLNTHTTLVSRRHLRPEVKGDLRFEHVSLVYPESGIKALDDISFHVPAGGKLAILGTTGSGKSSIANLICRLYDPTEGRILLDGVDLRDYDLTYLRSQIGYVPQDVFLFSDTIANNISFGMEEVSSETIEEAARHADVYDNIVDFPHGFDTLLGERGITLSGGQKQRVSIARALIRKPKLLLLDDCLSAVDTNTEHRILENLREMMEGRTSIIISHRVSSAKLADQIIVLDEGRIVERGTHESLMSAGGLYKQLYEKQLQSEESLE
ncbi:ATP-binding cassette subfamily B protein [Thermonema lapsum]|uniref:ATP-binding cassette subfamily B protein n=1 Tax=Thermonema lapsum TaxID=28195 RepID=A0A846MTZ5_9BACT|nr:ABC transporter ATP-binding protein [Thermonema lapsum]NIK74901.1 ATP-binding cassette subfamily B protein [Thermonema lapsum]